jgi:hypothetical protein
MKFLHASTAFLCSLLLASAPVLAQEPLRSKPVTVDGEPGVWFPRSDADRILFELTRTATLTAVVRDQERVINLQLQQIRTATTSLQVVEGIAQSNAELADTALDAYSEEVKRNSGLFREPIFLIGLGVLVGGGLVGLGAWASNQ